MGGFASEAASGLCGWSFGHAWGIVCLKKSRESGNLDLLVLLDRAKRTEKKEKRYNCENQARFHLLIGSKIRPQEAVFFDLPNFLKVRLSFL